MAQMFQIAHGELFRNGVHHITPIRGVLYGIFQFYRDELVDTAAGKVAGNDTIPHDLSLIYEFSETIEVEPSRPNLIVSFDISEYRRDLAALVAFFWQITCDRDADLVRRLISGERGLATKVAPRKLLRQVFEQELQLAPSDATELREIVDRIPALPRAAFLEVMHAIRAYVTGLHRMGDDLELAYTLTVASVESLAREFDDRQATWEDLENRKRPPIDSALRGIDTEASERDARPRFGSPAKGVGLRRQISL